MAAFALDTSCMIAAVCGWHEHHERARSEIERRLQQRERMAVAAPALVEAYAVLTRLSAPHRLAAADAWSLIDANFVRARKLVALTAEAYAELLRQAPANGIAGGKSYDAVIVHCALHAQAAALLTFNEADFAWAGQLGIEVVVPPAVVD
jgi:predicted nucleic acid-binding protein